MMIRANEVEYWSALGYCDKVEQAIAEGHDINAIGEDGYTALHAAVINGHVEIAKSLLRNGADPRATLGSGESPLDFAELIGNRTLIDLLRESVRDDGEI